MPCGGKLRSSVKKEPKEDADEEDDAEEDTVKKEKATGDEEEEGEEEEGGEEGQDNGEASTAEDEDAPKQNSHRTRSRKGKDSSHNDEVSVVFTYALSFFL